MSGHGCGSWRRARVLVAGSLLLAGLLASRSGGAQAPGAGESEAFRVVWSSSAGCREPGQFLRELASRTTRLRAAREGEHAITFIVEMFKSPGGVRGQLTVRKPDGDLTVREVPGLDCHEVESAMALIAALMVDPLAGNPERRAALSSSSRQPPAISAAPLAADAAPESSWSLRVEHRLTAQTALAPSVSWGQALGVMLEGQALGLAPSLAISGHFARSKASQTSGSAELEWLSAQVAACPLSFQPGPRWDFRPCLLVQAGRLRGAGFATFAPAEKSVFWSAMGLELEGRFLLAGPLWLGLEGALSLPFSRDRFFLSPSETLHEVPALGASFGVGSGLRFF